MRHGPTTAAIEANRNPSCHSPFPGLRDDPEAMSSPPQESGSDSNDDGFADVFELSLRLVPDLKKITFLQR